jgi:hypothetical protein
MSAGDAGAEPRWEDEVEALVRGLAHALGNRLAVVALAVDELDDPEAEVAADARARLSRESGRVAEVNRLLRLLPRERGARAEALQLAEVLDDALALHRHHPERRDRAVTVTTDAGVLPVRVERWALLRALLLLLGAAADGATQGPALAVRVSGDASVVRVRVVGGSGKDDASRAEEMVSLAGTFADRCGGRIERDEDGAFALALPSLLELRRREREGG